MGRYPAVLLITGAALSRFLVFLLIAVVAAPLVAATPPEPSLLSLNGPVDHNLSSASRLDRAGRYERVAYPTEQPRVPVNDALRPPQLLWNPTPASLVRIVPAKVRYKLKF
jgi:hypothetical protein